MDEPHHYLTVDDLTPRELDTVLRRAADLKERAVRGKAHPLLTDQTMAMLFEKPSTRTRVSFETGMAQLGGDAVFLGPDDTQLDQGEPIKDTARALSRYVDFITGRVFDHADVEELAAYASVPVVNALTDRAHPCQALADLLTIRERFGPDPTVAWVGDGNNVCQSFVLAAAMADVSLTVATPPAYAIADDVLDLAADLGRAPAVTDDPVAATADVDIVYTDVWVSMGQEDEREEKLTAFERGGYRVDTDLLGDSHFMHCLPARRGEEVTEAVLESEQSLVWDQAENRLHAQKGLLTFLG